MRRQKSGQRWYIVHVYAEYLDLSQPLLWTVADVMTPMECASVIERIEALGPTSAPITTGQGFVMRPDIRNNTRVIIDDPHFAAELFRRITAHVPHVMKGMQVVGVNERFRCYRYEPGQRFATHYDGAFIRNPQERSWLTFMVYLNEEFTGGETDFPVEKTKITPRTGMALLFQHHTLHEGCTVRSGTKYALRSDIMYRSPDTTAR